MTIIPFNPEFSEHFKMLNIEWLETYFYVEPFDLEVLSNPEEYIINKGGYIFFALQKNKVVGTVALMQTLEKGTFELTKMAVLPSYRGEGIGQVLLRHCIAFAKAKKFNRLLLYSNTLLKNAIYIYKKFGFIEIPLETESHYKRSNIKMEYLNLKQGTEEINVKSKNN